ncbi:hypothetical protein SIO70_16845 [Chitinophaga sancti]|uniref:hypothetical protein n=1 Tax=Chitinophaga sancti TaxID=1004 RepID=UPI002A75A176|nr:hypothetical protein [Chitinophaga sancti]WPQ66529.1 hypothetical protein SIO70_16845 [Chitinophaga sancti]
MKRLILMFCLAGSIPALAQSYDTLHVNNLSVGVGTYINSAFPMNVGAKARFSNQTHFGDWFDDTPYGYGIQIARPADQGDNRFHLSFVRAGQWVCGMGFLRASNTFAIQNSSTNASTGGIFISSAGYIGINKPSPIAELDVNGRIYMSGNYIYMNGNGTLYTDAGNMAMFTNGGYLFTNYANTKTRAQISKGGNLFLYDTATNVVKAVINPIGSSYLNGGGLAVGMSTLPTGYTLAVNGTIGGTKLKVTQSWADYVFAPGYKLPSLAEVEAHIKENHKLPDIPSEKQIAAEGLDVGEMQKLQMQKIEELTLYIIDLKKQLEAQQKEIEALKAK